MKLMTVLGVAVAATMTLAAPVGAADDNAINLGRMTSGYTYYNRPNAMMALQEADLLSCLDAASALESFQDRSKGGMGGLLGGLIAGAQADSANRGVVSAALENCMVVRGWRVVKLDDVEGEALSKLPAADLAARIAPWIGARNPHGVIVRSWHNDAALAAVNHFSLHAQHTRNGQLSLLAIGTTVSAAVRNTVDLRAGRAALSGSATALDSPSLPRSTLDLKWSKHPTKPEILDTAPAGSAIIIVNIKGVSLRQGNGFSFSRVADPRIGTDISAYEISAGMGTLGAPGDGKFFAFVVAPGRWRIASIWGGVLQLNFCLGSPGFDVKPGEVVYAGQLDLKQEKLLPDMNLAPVKTWLGASSSAGRARPAAYINGVRGVCASNSIYALEFDGMPFAEDYDVGSKVPPIDPAMTDKN